jgi:hypothetical protein
MSKEIRKKLLEEAKELNLEFPFNISTEKLQVLVDEAKTSNPEEPEANETPGSDIVEQLKKQQEQIDALMKELENKTSSEPATDSSDMDKLVGALTAHTRSQTLSTQPAIRGIDVSETPNKEGKIDKAMTLIRCRVLPRDPVKVGWKAELITVANDLIGDVRRRVDFNVDTHIPYCIYVTLKNKKVKIYDENKVSGDKKTGEITGGSDVIDAYSITLLPKLTEKELIDLARKQKLRSTDVEDKSDALLGINNAEEKPKSELEELGYDL